MTWAPTFLTAAETTAQMQKRLLIEQIVWEREHFEKIQAELDRGGERVNRTAGLADSKWWQGYCAGLRQAKRTVRFFTPVSGLPNAASCSIY